MPQNISHMRPAKDTQSLKNRKEHVRRTTIILEEEERKYIDKLIKDGKEAGIKQLISKMLDVYRSMMIYDWKYPGEYYGGISRVAFINIEFINRIRIIILIPVNQELRIALMSQFKALEPPGIPKIRHQRRGVFLF